MKRNFIQIILGISLLLTSMFLTQNIYAKPLRIAVIDIGYLDIEPKISVKFSKYIRAEFSKYKTYSVVPHDKVEEVFHRRDIFSKQRLKQYDCTFVPCAEKVARYTKSKYTIIGRLIKEDDNKFVAGLQIVGAGSRRIEFSLNYSFIGEKNFLNSAFIIVKRLDMWFPQEGESTESIKIRRNKLAKIIDDEYKKYQELEKKKKNFKHKQGECPQRMALIPAGQFKYGSPKSDQDRYGDEKENETVNLDEYCIDIYEFPNKKGKRPLVKQEWFGAKASCEDVKKSLCTEKQWEKACKGPQNTSYSYGNKFDQNKCNTPYIRNGKTIFDRKMAISGKYEECRNEYGIHDMNGNVYEWVSDFYEKGGTRQKVIRGGSWFDQKTKNTRCATRNLEIPFAHDKTIGFRCCLN